MNGKRVNRVLSPLNLVAFVGVVVINYLAVSLPLNNKSTGELSDQYPNLFVPAGLTFSIWGVIYVLLAIYAIYQLVVAFRRTATDGSFLDRIGVLFILSSVANMGWIFAWHYELVSLSLVIMLLLLLTLIAIYLRLGIGRSAAPGRERYLVHLPFSVYLGWITVATIANVTALLVDMGWNRFGLSEAFWTVAVIAVGVAITLVMLLQRRDVFYSLVVLWALLGILLKRMAVEVQPIVSVRVAVIVGMALVGAGILAQLARRKVY
jgi:hypothetical protein